MKYSRYKMHQIHTSIFRFLSLNCMPKYKVYLLLNKKLSMLALFIENYCLVKKWWKKIHRFRFQDLGFDVMSTLLGNHWSIDNWNFLTCVSDLSSNNHSRFFVGVGHESTYARSICIVWKLEFFHLPKLWREPTKIGHNFRI